MVIGGVNQTIIEEDINGIDDGEDGVADHMYNSVMVVDNIGQGVSECVDESALGVDKSMDRSTLSKSKSLNSGAQTQRNIVLHQD